MEENINKNGKKQPTKKLIINRKKPPPIEILLEYEHLFVTIQSWNTYVDIMFLDGENIVELEYTMTMKAILLLLCPITFIRAHNRCIMNQDYALYYKTNDMEGYDVKMRYGEDVKVAKRRRDYFRKNVKIDFIRQTKK